MTILVIQKDTGRTLLLIDLTVIHEPSQSDILSYAVNVLKFSLSVVMCSHYPFIKNITKLGMDTT